MKVQTKPVEELVKEFETNPAYKQMPEKIKECELTRIKFIADSVATVSKVEHMDGTYHYTLPWFNNGETKYYTSIMPEEVQTIMED